MNNYSQLGVGVKVLLFPRCYNIYLPSLLANLADLGCQHLP